MSDMNPEEIADFLKEISKTRYDNAPATLDEAIERLARAEFLLEDLARGAELVEITKDTRLAHVFRVDAEAYLENKMVKREPTKITQVAPGDSLTINI